MSKPTKTLAAIVAALFPNSEKAIAEKLTQEEFNAFASEAQEAQDRLDAQAEGNQAVADDLTKANSDLAAANGDLTKAKADLEKANSDLATANARIAELEPKAKAWDAHKAALAGATVIEDTTNAKGGKDKASSDLTDKDQKHLARLTELKAKYPGLMADIDVPTSDEE